MTELGQFDEKGLEIFLINVYVPRYDDLISVLLNAYVDEECRRCCYAGVYFTNDIIQLPLNKMLEELSGNDIDLITMVIHQ